MTNELQDTWITIRTNERNREHLKALSIYYNKSKSQFLRDLIDYEHSKIYGVTDHDHI